MTTDFGVYIHIPFCKHKCFYCDFPSFAGREKYIDEYLNSLHYEMELGAEKIAEKGKLTPHTIYIGGGTPSHLNLSQMKILFKSIHANMQVKDVAEFTMEANPCTIDEEKLHLMKSNGINRISIGVQSFDDGCLQRIGRIHKSSMAIEKVRLAQKAGFDNISIDLMYGLPGQTLDMLKKSLDKAMELGIQHISVYGLQLEEGTVLAKQQEMGRLELPDDEAVEKMYDYLVEYLPAHGFSRYEISNYAMGGYYSRHNTLYWQDVPYLGFGSGAHSYWRGNRYENPVDIGEYIKATAEGKFLHIVEEAVSEKAHMEEFCFLGLRMTKGINKEKFREIFNRDIYEVFGKVIDKMVAKALLGESETAIFLTPLGMKYGNVVFGEFILE
ncbi:oxygen-independent coproporphyrinogen-3 oxidase [Anaerovibrio lipolyticus DSM 3074]|uniref:Heme chaperone HemW n=1 Tax=Anaerovibrio lipolyticus DSM 3074 TaxID=1120997 RepID=A0A1M6BH98_9FIRM|nr:radical SAM family heme chaperone HemW [Anaerovibrio lipolyticus]SHI47958.1 oxygen-independent coproporphyrinogen-3 oxidase [Anaerovibrio lipolyticus DSM 3074]